LKAYQVLWLKENRLVGGILRSEESEGLADPTNSLAQTLLDSPLAGSELPVERDPSLPRKINIDP
jgi:hypothetical protein